MTKEALRWEESACRIAPPEGWACVKCHRWYNEDERAARYCCHTDKPCGTPGCSGRADRSYTACKACRDRKTDERWLALAKVPLPDDLSAQPCCTWDSDRYFFDIDDLLEYADEYPDARFELCKRASIPHFEASEFLSDICPEDGEVDDSNDEKINALIREIAPETWFGSGIGIDPESVATALAAGKERDEG